MCGYLEEILNKQIRIVLFCYLQKYYIHEIEKFACSTTYLKSQKIKEHHLGASHWFLGLQTVHIGSSKAGVWEMRGERWALRAEWYRMLPTSLLLLGAAYWNALNKLQGSLNEPYVNYIEDHHKFDCLKFIAITDFINDFNFCPVQ